MKSREIRLKRYPEGLPEAGDFELIETELPEPGAGEIIVRNLWLSVDPYMRGRMTRRESYIAPFEIGQPLDGAAIGRVVKSNANSDFKEGDFVRSFFSWREAFLSDGGGLEELETTADNARYFLGPLGAPGLTAYVGLLEIGKPQKGNTVFVSGAAGSVGSLACQIARIKGCRVVASAGTDEKTDWLKNVAKVDATINYRKAEDLGAALKAACPDGIDVYFDNVGGDHLVHALDNMNVHGRIAACGAISTYNDKKPSPGPANIFSIVSKRLTMQGFLVTDHFDKMSRTAADIGRWIDAGEINTRETVFEGIDNAVGAFLGLFRGDNIGKALVRLPE